MLSISTPARTHVFQPVRYSKTELPDKSIYVESVRHQRSDHALMVVLFRYGLLFKNLVQLKEFDDDLNSHMEIHGDLELADYFQKCSFDAGPVIYEDEPVPMHLPIDTDSDRQHHVVTEKSLASLLPITAIDLVNDYAAEQFTVFNPTDWSRPDNCSLKRKMIRFTLEHGNEALLNASFERLRDAGLSIDLSRVDLSGLNLSKLNLSKLNLAGAVLIRANVTGTNLTGVNLSKADLSYADLTTAMLLKADLSGAILIGANLALANCEYVNLNKANLSGAMLNRTNMRYASLLRAVCADAIMTGINLSYANLYYANLKNTVLCNAWLVETMLVDADLSGAQLNGSCLVDADLSAANLADASLGSAYLENVVLSRACLMRTNLVGANLVGTNIEHAHGTESNGQLVHGSRFFQLGVINQRRIVTEKALHESMPTSIIDLISAYDGNSESTKIQTFSEISNLSDLHFENSKLSHSRAIDRALRSRNRDFFFEALGSDDVALKEQIIRSLVGRNKIAYLNNVFEKIRGMHGRINLAYIDLSRLNLSKLDLSQSDLRYANLSGVLIGFTSLSNVELFEANLAGAVFTHTALRQVMLENADLSKARFESCVIEFSSLNGADLSGAMLSVDFFKVYMPNANLSQATFRFSSVIESDWSGVSLVDAVLNGVHIRKSNLLNVDADRVRLIGTSKDGVVLASVEQLSDQTQEQG